MRRRDFFNLGWMSAAERRKYRSTQVEPLQKAATGLGLIGRSVERKRDGFWEIERPFFTTPVTVPNKQQAEVIDRIDHVVWEKSSQRPNRWVFWTNGKQLVQNEKLHKAFFHRLSGFIEDTNGRIPKQQTRAIRQFLVDFANSCDAQDLLLPIEMSVANWAYSWNGLVQLCYESSNDFEFHLISNRETEDAGSQFYLPVSSARNGLEISANDWMVATANSPVSASRVAFKCQHIDRTSSGVGLNHIRSTEHRLRMYDVQQEMEVAENAGYWIRERFSGQTAESPDIEIHLGTSEIRVRLVRYAVRSRPPHGIMNTKAHRGELCLHRGHGGLFQVITRSTTLRAYEAMTPGESGFICQVADVVG